MVLLVGDFNEYDTILVLTLPVSFIGRGGKIDGLEGSGVVVKRTRLLCLQLLFELKTLG